MIKPIKAAVDEVKKFVQTLKNYFDGLSFRRRLEELTPAEVAHAHGLKEQAHRQLTEVRGRLLHADNDDARDSTNERLVLDIHRRLEAHLAERKLAARQLGSDDQLISISSLKASITLEINSRMLIEGQKDDDFLLPLVTEDKAIDMIIGLSPTPFVVKLSAAFSADIHLAVEVEGDFKALVHLVASGMGVTFDLSQPPAPPEPRHVVSDACVGGQFSNGQVTPTPICMNDPAGTEIAVSDRPSEFAYWPGTFYGEIDWSPKTRCCELTRPANFCDSERSGGGACYGTGQTWAEAHQTCIDDGRRLCTVAELAKCCSTGCNYDSYLTWAEEACPPPPPSTGADKPVVFSEGDWTQAITLEVLSERCATQRASLPFPSLCLGLIAALPKLGRSA